MTITRRAFIFVVASAALAPIRAGGQRANRTPRIALVFGAIPTAEMAGPDPAHPYARAFVHALRDLGLVDGRNVVIERRSAEGRSVERMDALMQEVVRLGVDVIVTTGGPGVRAAQRATDRIPIVGVVADALETGLVNSLSRPGGNLTGIGESNSTLNGKQLQLLKEAAPAISRVAVLGYRPLPGARASWRVATDEAARALHLDLLWLDVDAPEDLERAFAKLIRDRADALFALGTHVNFANARRIAEFANKHRLPSVGFPEDGMLLSYGADFLDSLRRAAVLTKKILDGAKPGDLPFEQPTKFTLVINLRTAKALGLTVPPSLLLRADEKIE